MKQLNIFDGIVNNKYDSLRLGKQAKIIFATMSDRHWRTLHQIHLLTGFPTTSISAQLRNFRKEKFGNHTLLKRRTKKGGGTYEYRLIVNTETVSIINHLAKACAFILMMMCSFSVSGQSIEDIRQNEIEKMKAHILLYEIKSQELFPMEKPIIQKGIGEYEVINVGGNQKGYYFHLLKPLNIDTINQYIQRDRYPYYRCGEQTYFSPIYIKDYLPFQLKRGNIIQFNLSVTN